MILPIYAYGQPVLKRKAREIELGHEGLDKLLSDMWETLYHADGVGLAAPQVGQGIRIFLVDTLQLLSDETDVQGAKKVFINPLILEEDGEPWEYEEGCLSIPTIRGDVERLSTVTIRYYDENFEEHTDTFDGITARVIQHEYDHLEGILFTELLKPVKRRMIQRKLDKIKKGKVDSDYEMVYVR